MGPSYVAKPVHVEREPPDNKHFFAPKLFTAMLKYQLSPILTRKELFQLYHFIHCKGSFILERKRFFL